MHRSIPSTTLLLATVVLVALAGPSFAANCSKKPDHPDCSPPGGGGDGGGSTPPRSVPALVFHNPKTGKIETVNPDGSNRTALPGSWSGYGVYPQWSPDGTRIAFGCGRVRIIDHANGSSFRDATPAGFAGNGSCSVAWAPGNVPGWGPDGDLAAGGLIAFGGGEDINGDGWARPSSTSPNERDDIWLLNPDTGALHNLTADLTFADPALQRHTSNATWGWISWSTDASRFAVTSHDDAGQETAWVFDLGADSVTGLPMITEAHDITALTTPPGATTGSTQRLFLEFSSTDRSVVLWATRGDLYRTDIKSHSEPLTGAAGLPNPGWEVFPAPSPNDGQITFMLRDTRSVTSGKGLFLLDIDTGTVTTVVPSSGKADPRRADWNPLWGKPTTP